MHPFVDHATAAARLRRDERSAAHDVPERGEVGLKVAMATLPLIGLVAGVVGTALWLH
ncbi:MAG TPA: hypothetical protein VMU08_03375 [Rhizomicrobium sp.]|nr:hypothetical protein [Rhizomicrobium sp.]